MVSKRNILLILAEKDFNETEFLTVRNKLQERGFKIFIASDAQAVCSGSGGLKVKGDISFYNIHPGNFSAMVIIGGKGIRNYWDNGFLHSAVRKFYDLRKVVAAICSAPVILSRAGLLSGTDAVCFYEDKRQLEGGGAVYNDSAVVVRGNLITAKDEHAAGEFAAAVIESITA